MTKVKKKKYKLAWISDSKIHASSKEINLLDDIWFVLDWNFLKLLKFIVEFRN